MADLEVDSAHQENLKLSKMKKKVLRKQIKAQRTLMRHEGIECISHTTQVTWSSYCYYASMQA